MLPRTDRRRAGISLIELLVVISIIAVLMSLLMAAVQRVRVLGPQTENFHRMNQMADAIGRLKNDLKLEYVPSHPVSPGGFRLQKSYGPNDPELVFLQRAFPNMNLSDNGYVGPNLVLDSNQVLVFFLWGVGDGTPPNPIGFGFSNNPSKPLTPARAGEQRKGPWIEFNAKMFAAGANGYPHVVDVYGTPYAYFASVNAKPNNYGNQTFTLVTPPVGPVSPYLSGGRAVNEKGFQIISAGRDKVFGPGGAVVPATGAGADDHAHFQKSLLGAGLNN